MRSKGGKDTKNTKDTKERKDAKERKGLRGLVACSFVSFVSFASFVSFPSFPSFPSQRPFRSGVDGVLIPVSVRRANKPVAGLRAADFELRDNGVPQQLQDVTSEKSPIDITLLLDLSSSVDGPALQRLKAAVRDTAGLLRGDDRLRLVAISQVLREIFPFRSGAADMPLDALSAEGATSLYDGLAATMMRPSEIGRRQLIVAFTDGRDSTSIVDEGALKAIAELSDAVVDIVVPLTKGRAADAPGGLPRESSPADAVPPVLAELVAPTAGQVLGLTGDASISPVFKAMLDDFRATYVLQYVPRDVQPDGWHDVEITVKKRGKYDIRARKGYRGRSTIPREEKH